MVKRPRLRVQNDTLDHASSAPDAGAAVRRALVESHISLAAFLRRRFGNAEDAEEVLQLFLIRALERADELRDARSVRGWLGRILATTIIDHQRRMWRSRKRETALPDEDVFALEPDAEVDQAVCDCLYKLLPTLKPEYAAIIWRVDLIGEPRERIAASLSTTLNNVNVRLHRARQALRTRLEEMCLTCPVHGFLDCRCDEARRRRDALSHKRNDGDRDDR